MNEICETEGNFLWQEDLRMYAIMFDLDPEILQRAYPGPSWNNAYAEIQKVLARHGFTRQQGSVYFGGPQVNAVTCVLASIDLSRSLPWFAISVRDIRMLRIEEQNDLAPAVQQGADMAG
ncbi:virulence factor [Zavarzinella formosa]|uniref:virulence factor n=1 Tax=Zavarzinella formosa TaxID=360055 RepID=UPI001930DC1E|nr:virulence factor [Zavarzinella formosa]